MSVPVLSQLFIVLTPRIYKLQKLLTGPSTPKSRQLHQSSHSFTIQRVGPYSVKRRWTTPSPQSQSLSRSYGSNLPTSLIYIILLTRGYSPWRPDAVISTDNEMSRSRKSILILLFKDPLLCTGEFKILNSFTNNKTFSRIHSIPSFCYC